MRTGLGGVSSVALIGGTSDIGAAIAEELRGIGAERFMLTARRPEEVSDTRKGVSTIALDIADFSAHESAVEHLFADGDLDVVVFAAGVLINDPDPDQVTEMAVVNGAGSTALLAKVAQRMQEQGHGHIVVLSSMAVVRARPSNYWYGASKAGLDFAARGLGDSLEGTAVKVSIVRPGFVHTKMTEGMSPAPLSCKPSDVGKAVAEMVRADRGGVLWVPGALRYLALVLQILPLGLLRRLDR
jgi:decaprenylphospho-beta-D-erythro-pentofuranosid-2-ulose 2-reductase